ncbi:MAG: 4Fe-4S binding protein [Desulfobulbaceae bacterium]|nr:4Fe-4S binding protein [Desulfobulbaceae bacterium]
MWQVEIDWSKCVGDEECVESCPAQVFEMIKNKPEPLYMAECLGCETCVDICPEEAITFSEIEIT